MSTAAKQRAQERQAAVAQVAARQRQAERRRTRWVVGASVAVALGLVVPAAVVLVTEQRRQDAVAEAASRPIDGVVEYDVASANHVTTPVSYPQAPPVGGDHDPVWQNCGFYDAEVRTENAVHSLEHGAVWLTYGPDLPAAQLTTLRDLAAANPYLLVSPAGGASSDLVASAWGVQVELEGADDERLEPFLRAYLQGPQTPEPGAACSGGLG